MRKLSKIQPARYADGPVASAARTLSALVCLCGLSLSWVALAQTQATKVESTRRQTNAEQTTRAASQGTAHRVAHGQLGPGENTLYVGLLPPKGAKLTQGSPVEIRAIGRGLSFPERVKVKLEPGAHIPVPVKINPGSSDQAEFKISYYWCHDSAAGSSGQCVRENAQVTVSLDISGDRGGGEAYFDYQADGGGRAQ